MFRSYKAFKRTTFALLTAINDNSKIKIGEFRELIATFAALSAVKEDPNIKAGEFVWLSLS